MGRVDTLDGINAVIEPHPRVAFVHGYPLAFPAGMQAKVSAPCKQKLTFINPLSVSPVPPHDRRAIAGALLPVPPSRAVERLGTLSSYVRRKLAMCQACRAFLKLCRGVVASRFPLFASEAR
jgi:hypothetical protein